MPHFILHCSAPVLEIQPEETLLCEVFQVADESRIFATKDIKVRLQSFKTFLTGGEDDDFIHVFGNIMQGRTDEQKARLSRAIVSRLTELLPGVPIVSMNVRDFEKASYCNRTML